MARGPASSWGSKSSEVNGISGGELGLLDARDLLGIHEDRPVRIDPTSMSERAGLIAEGVHVSDDGKEISPGIAAADARADGDHLVDRGSGECGRRPSGRAWGSRRRTR